MDRAEYVFFKLAQVYNTVSNGGSAQAKTMQAPQQEEPAKSEKPVQNSNYKTIVPVLKNWKPTQQNG